MPGTHSKYSPSKLGRILSCTASGRIQDTNRSSSYADEGTMLHDAIEKCIRGYLNDTGYGQILATLNPEHRVAVEDCLDYFFGLLKPYMAVSLEERVYISEGCDGTLDLGLAGGGEIHVIDWKFGKGVSVYAENNDQLKAYAAGFCDAHNLYTGDVHVHIVQPRINNYSEVVYTIQELYEWRDTVLIPTLNKIEAGEVSYNPSTENCRWCPDRATCTARIDQAFKNAEDVFAEYREMPTLPSDRYADLISKAKEVEQVIKDLEAHTLVMLKHGEKVKGMKLVHGRSSRAWKDDQAAIMALKPVLKEDQLFTKKMVSPAQAEKLVPKTMRKDEAFLSLVEKKQGKLTAVPESDKRQEVADPAGAAFANVKEE